MTLFFDEENFTPKKCSETGKLLFNRCKEEGLI
jgi:hypothetical protein